MQFLKTLTGPAWFCFGVACAGMFFSICAWLPWRVWPAQLSTYLALAAFFAGLVGFISLASHHIVTWQHRKEVQPKVQLPRVFWVAVVGALAYFVAVFVGIFIVYPQGVDLGSAVSLRVASAAALFFGVATLGFTQWAGLRVRALRSVP